MKDWSIRENEPVATDAEVAWTGENEESRKLGGKIQLFRHVVNNPLPSDEIKTIDFVSTMTESAPFLSPSRLNRSGTTTRVSRR